MSLRIEGWEGRLYQVIAAAAREPYVLGKHDCFRVACQAIEALTGVNRWPEFAGRYSTRREALALIAQYGHNFEHAFSWFFGVEPVAPAWARRGDILHFRDPSVVSRQSSPESHLGVCLGAQTAVLGETGLLYVRTRACVCAWPIG